MSSVLVLAEARGDNVREAGVELISSAQFFVNRDRGEQVHVARIGPEDVGLEPLQREGVDRLHHVVQEGGYNNQRYARLIASLVDELKVEVVLLPHTVTGMDLSPAIAGELDRPCITNVVALHRNDDVPRITRKLYGGKVDATVGVDGSEMVMTLREGQFPAPDPDQSVEVSRFEVDVEEIGGTELLSLEELDFSDEIDITTEEFIISVGLGIGDQENMELIEELADLTGAVVASSRPIVERGWLPRSRQVGQSGNTVSPRVYVAIGISGAIEHRVGMKSSDTIIAINNDPDAPIFDLADYGIVDDWEAVVPTLIEQLR